MLVCKAVKYNLVLVEIAHHNLFEFSPISHLPTGNVSQTELWGRANDSSMREYCPPCYRPDLGQKLWGYTSIVMDPTYIVNGSFSQLAELANMNYVYKLYRSATVDSSTPDLLIGQTADNDMSMSDMLRQIVTVPSSQVG